LDADADAFIGYAVEGAERLKTLLQDLLELQQVGKGDRPVLTAPLSNAVKKARENLALEIGKLGAQITYDELPEVPHDEQAITQLFVHLFENALKYRREDVTPEIHVSAERIGRSGFWEIRVKDNGIGIPAEFSDKVFNVFQRLHPRSQYPGTGIGLAICKKVVELHRGEIRVESTPGSGSTFIFTLQVSRA